MLLSLGRMAPVLFALLILSIPTVVAGQCVTKPSSCTEFVTVGSGPGRILVYRNQPLTTANNTVTRAVVVVHGAGGPARWEFRSVLAAAYLSGNLDSTLIVAPHFASNDGSACKDSLAENELNWNCDILLGDWRVGGQARNNSAMSSFDAMDAILLQVANRKIFPNLKSIVLAGHSAGGQFVTLYQAVNQVHERLGVATFYVVANASAYPYLDNRRPVPVAPSTANNGEGEHFQFTQFTNARDCADYARWPFGLVNRVGYAARVSESQIKEQAARRPVTYLLGQQDVVAPGGFFGSCAGMAQGGSRLARGMAFAQYMKEFSREGVHKVVLVDGCGHDARCVYTSDDALPALLPKMTQ
jgi:pimeloyl-ACP methyl ester carboxylesterase